MATLACVVACGVDHTVVVDIGMALKVVGAVAGITIIKGIGLRHGLANSAADQSDGGGCRGVAGLAGIMTLGVCGADRKCRRMTVDGTGGQQNWRRLIAILIGDDIASQVIICMAEMTVAAGNRI